MMEKKLARVVVADENPSAGATGSAIASDDLRSKRNAS